MTDTLFPDNDPMVEATLEELRLSPYWPYDPVHDGNLVRQLRREFPTLNLPKMVLEWSAWMADHRSRKQVRHRARLHRWCTNAASWKPAGARAGTVAASAEEHGPTSGLDVW
jgi:hypothetical protein